MVILNTHFDGTTKFMHYNQNVKGGTFINVNGANGKSIFRVDWDPSHSYHMHPLGHK